jgi:tripartite ATP-independent transporter DctM subunit
MRAAAVRAENGFATIVACGVIGLPLAEIAARTFLSTSIPGAGLFTIHLTMWVGLLGAAIAARDGKLLALATGEMIPKGRFRDITRVIAGFVAAGVSAIFAIGAGDYVYGRYTSQRELAAGVPEWIAELVLPIAFGLIALRLAWNASSSWIGRAIAAAGLVGGVWLGLNPLTLELASPWPWLTMIIVATILGAPVFVLLGGSAVMLFLTEGIPPSSPIIDAHAQLTLESLPAIPLFTLAGYFLAEGKSSERLLRLFRAWIGWLPGGTAGVAAAVCAFFTLLTGGSGVTILALGGLLLPTLLADGYRERFSVGLLTSAGSLGLLFPLALPLILYAVVAQNVMMEDLFLGGLLPGTLMLGMLMLYGMREGIVAKAARHPFRTAEVAAATWIAKWELLLPVVVLGSIFVAGATIAQAAAIAALYALIVQRFIHRDLGSFGDITRVVGDSVALSGGVLIILAAAVGFTNYLITAQVPANIIEWTKANIESPLVFLLALNGFLLIVGCLMDIFSAIVVVVPLVVPIAQEYGIDPVHLGIIFVANLELGYITPPVGLNLFLASYRFKKPLLEVARATLPMLAILALGVLLITYVPWLTTGILEWLGRR